MKIFKVLGLIIVSLLALVCVLSLLAPNRVETSSTTTINADQATVFSLVNELPTWERWSPWQRRDPTIKNEYSEKKAGSGAYYTWTSEDSGAGQMTITDSYGPDSLHATTEFDGQGTSYSNWYFMPVDQGTEVTWTFKSEFSFPWNAMLLFMDMKGMIDEDFKQGLAYLKEEAESILPEGPDLTVKRVEYPTTHYLVKRKTVSMQRMEEYFQQTMPDIGMTFGKSGVEMAGDPVGIFYTWDEASQTSDVAIGIPAAAGATIDGLIAIDVPGGPALQIDYVGSYAGTAAAHEAMGVYLEANGLTAKEPAIERYMADPGPETETDPNKWMTQIVYLLEE